MVTGTESSGEEGGGDWTRTFFTIFFGFVWIGSSGLSWCSGTAVLKVVTGGRGADDGVGLSKLELGAGDPLGMADEGEGPPPVFRRKGLLEPKDGDAEDMVARGGDGY